MWESLSSKDKKVGKLTQLFGNLTDLLAGWWLI
jgi:hypothetical protein